MGFIRVVYSERETFITKYSIYRLLALVCGRIVYNRERLLLLSWGKAEHDSEESNKLSESKVTTLGRVLPILTSQLIVGFVSCSRADGVAMY